MQVCPVYLNKDEHKTVVGVNKMLCIQNLMVDKSRVRHRCCSKTTKNNDHIPCFLSICPPSPDAPFDTSDSTQIQILIPDSVTNDIVHASYIIFMLLENVRFKCFAGCSPR